jgi:hypothetical protein
MDKGNITKRTKVAILRRPTRKTLKWCDAMKSCRGLNVHKVNSNRNSFILEQRRQVAMSEQSQECDDAYAQQHRFGA